MTVVPLRTPRGPDPVAPHLEHHPGAVEGDLHAEAVLVVLQTEPPHPGQFHVQPPAPQVQLPLEVVRAPGPVVQPHQQAPLQAAGLQPQTAPL